MDDRLCPFGDAVQHRTQQVQRLQAGFLVRLRLLVDVDGAVVVRQLRKEAHHVRHEVEYLRAALHQLRKALIVHLAAVAEHLVEPRRDHFQILFRGQAANVFGIEPRQLLHVEDTGRFVDTVDVERLHQFVKGEEFAVVAGIPADQRQIIDDGFDQIALVHIVGEVRVAVALGQLMLRIAHDRRHVDILRNLPAERLIEQVILRRRGQVLHAAHDVGDAHQVVVDDVGEVVGRHTVLLNQHHVVERVIREGHVAEHEVIIAGFARRRRVLADDIRHARIQLALNFLLRQVQAVLVVLEHFALRFARRAALFQLFLRAEAVVSVARLDQLLCIGQVQILALRLDVRADRAAHVRAFIPVHAAAAQRVVNDLRRAFHKAHLIRILNAQDEFAPILPGKQIPIQCRAQSAQMHKARRRRRKSCTHFLIHFLILLSSMIKGKPQGALPLDPTREFLP